MTIPYDIHPDHLRLRIRLTPKASANRIQGLWTDEYGQVWLKVSVTAAPENGKANAALIKLLGKKLGLAKSALDILSGGTNRHKTFRLSGDPADLTKKIKTLL